MKNPSLSLLSLIPLLLLLAVSPLPVSAAMRTRRAVLLPLAGPSSYSHVECLGDGVYVANSTYQANLRRVAVLLVADAAATRGANYTSRSVGYWPNRLLASSFCHGTASDSSACAACVAWAFRKVERACPYHREAYFYSLNCTLQLDEFRIFGFADNIFEETNILKQALASGLIFQAIGFAWLFFLLLQEWRSRKRGTLMQPTPVSSGD